MTSAVVAGEELLLLPERAAYWPRERTLFVADIHLGKAQAFRAARIPVPDGPDTTTLARLEHAVKATDPTKVIFLGDLWHAKSGRSEEGLGDLAKWRSGHPSVEVMLIVGNHDIRSGALPAECGIEEREEGERLGPFNLRHHPEPGDGYVLCGHLHPGADLVGKGRQALRLPCFWFGKRVGVLPAFGEFTGMASVRAKTEDEVFVVADGRVLRVS